MSNHTPGPWKYEPGGGHAYNRIVGSDIVQTNGWPEPINGISNASYSERVCENLGDIDLPGPAANVKLICAAPELLRLLGVMFDAYENGVPCYEDPEEFTGPLGNAIKLDDADFHKIADLLNELDPRS
jgi:hypothetical protein